MGAALETPKQLSWKDQPKAVGDFFLRLLYTGTVDAQFSEKPIQFDPSKPLGLFLTEASTGDVFLNSVSKGGQADLAGVRSDWRVLRAGDKTVTSVKDLKSQLSSMKAAGLASATITFEPAVPLAFLLGGLALAKMYAFQDVLAVVLRALCKR